MALNSVQYRPPDQTKVVGAHEGGGRTGQIIGGAVGGVAGGMAGFATGGPAGAVAGGIGGAAGGAALGGTIGNMVAPPSAGTTAIDRRLSMQQPQLFHSDRSEALRQSLIALSQQPQELKDAYSQPLIAAYVSSLANDHTGMTLPGQVDTTGVA